MKIQTIEFSELFNLGNYENLKVAATAVVAESESPEEVLAALQLWVNGQVLDAATAKKSAEKEDLLTEQVKALQADRDRLFKEIQKLRNEHGLFDAIARLANDAKGVDTQAKSFLEPKPEPAAKAALQYHNDEEEDTENDDDEDDDEDE